LKKNEKNQTSTSFRISKFLNISGSINSKSENVIGTNERNEMENEMEIERDEMNFHKTTQQKPDKRCLRSGRDNLANLLIMIYIEKKMN